MSSPCFDFFHACILVFCTYQYKLSGKSLTKLSHFCWINCCVQVKDISAVTRIVTLFIPIELEVFYECYFGKDLLIAPWKLSTALFHLKWIKGI